MVFLVIALSMAAFYAGLAFGIEKTAYQTYQYFGEAMNYAAACIARDGTPDQVHLRTEEARQAFQYALGALTDTVWNGAEFVPKPGNKAIVGPIKLKEFRAVSPGDPVPGGRAGSPGYLASIEVPLLGGTYPIIGEQYLTVPMKQFGAVVSQKVN